MPYDEDDLCITDAEYDQILLDGGYLGMDCIEGTADDPQSNSDASPFFEQEMTDCGVDYVFEASTC